MLGRALVHVVQGARLRCAPGAQIREARARRSCTRARAGGPRLRCVLADQRGTAPRGGRAAAGPGSTGASRVEPRTGAGPGAILPHTAGVQGAKAGMDRRQRGKKGRARGLPSGACMALLPRGRGAPGRAPCRVWGTRGARPGPPGRCVVRTRARPAAVQWARARTRRRRRLKRRGLPGWALRCHRPGAVLRRC